MRVCKWCNKPFTPRRVDMVYCKKKCKDRASRRRTGQGREYQRRYKRPYVTYKKEVCERCGFVPEHPCQLDIHHIDHNHDNNEKENLETLCSNCHRLHHFG